MMTSRPSTTKTNNPHTRPLVPLATVPLALVLVLVFLIHLPCVAARSWTAAELPSPQDDPGGICGRKVRSSVCDPDGYLSQSDADEIQGLSNFINNGSHGFKKLPCPGGTSGPQVAVAIVSSMRPASGDKKKRAFQFARDLHDRWGVGDSACQNGLVLFFAVKDRAMGFSTGAGLKRVFTDEMIPAVMHTIAPLLRKEEYGHAIIRAVTAIGNVLSGGEPPADDGGGGIDIGGALFAVGIGSAVIGSAVMSARSRRRYSSCRQVLRRIDTDRQRASANEYVCTSCPICLEDFDDSNGPTSGPSNNRSDATSTTATGATTRAATTTKTTMSTKRGVADGPDVEAQPLSTDFASGTRQPAAARRTTTQPDALSTGTIDSDATRGTTLTCGHRFHESCIATWMSGPRSNSNSCPICRQPVGVAMEATADGREVEERTNRGRPSGWDVYDPEYRFRVQRAQYFYPDYITWAMVDSWNRDRYVRDRPMASSSAFVAVDPVVVAQAARTSGSGGSSFSFGGGSSAGGGGGGGGW